MEDAAVGQGYHRLARGLGFVWPFERLASHLDPDQAGTFEQRQVGLQRRNARRKADDQVTSVIAERAECQFGCGTADGVEDDIDGLAIIGLRNLLAPVGSAGFDDGFGAPGNGGLNWYSPFAVSTST